MLDWYHLEKKMTELLSMALKGSKDARHEIRNALNRKPVEKANDLIVAGRQKHNGMS